ncbi:hypothetical protein I3760_15G140600 [Carya illinoinensis]|nr:hypothetical protein I3760_15G140600 [Carya illinoinensis]
MISAGEYAQESRKNVYVENETVRFARTIHSVSSSISLHSDILLQLLHLPPPYLVIPQTRYRFQKRLHLPSPFSLSSISEVTQDGFMNPETLSESQRAISILRAREPTRSRKGTLSLSQFDSVCS